MTDSGVDDPFRARRAADRAFLGLELAAPDRGAFTLTRALARHDGKLYGGTAVAAAVALAEEASGRPLLWTTVQFVSGDAGVGDRIDVAAEVLAAGRRTAQVRVTARRDDQLLFTALGANGQAKEGAPPGTFATMPDVAAPEDCEPFRLPIPAHLAAKLDQRRHMEIRTAGRDRATGELRFWSRVRDRRVTPALLGYLADMVPVAIVQASGHSGGGISIDNTLRMGHAADTEWVLLQLVPHLATGGYGTGAALLWSPDGTLMGVASQTAALIVLD